MCVILEADFIVGLTVKGKSIINKLLKLGDEIEFSINDCLNKQQMFKTSGWGNVIAESTYEDFSEYLMRNHNFFEFKPNGNYRVIRENLIDGDSGEIDYERLLTIGVYNGAIFDVFNYPRKKELAV